MHLCYYTYYFTARIYKLDCLGSGNMYSYCLSWWDGLGLYYLFLQKQLELFRNSFSTCIKYHLKTPASLAASQGGLYIHLFCHSLQPTWLWIGLTWSLEDPFIHCFIDFKNIFSRHNEKLTQGSSFSFGLKKKKRKKRKIHILTLYCLEATLSQSDPWGCSGTRFYSCGSLTPFRVNILIFE